MAIIYDNEFRDLGLNAQQSGNPGFLYAGSADPSQNPSNGFVVSSNADLEIGLDVRYAGDPTNVNPIFGTQSIFAVDATRLTDVRFAYSIASEDETIDLSNYTITLSIDTDPEDTVKFVNFTLEGVTDAQPTPSQNGPGDSPYQFAYENNTPSFQILITDDGGNSSVTQNIQAPQLYFPLNSEPIN